MNYMPDIVNLGELYFNLYFIGEDTEALKLDQHGHRAGLGRGSPKLYGPQTAAFSSPLLGPACPTSAVGSRTQVQNAGLATPELGVPRQVTQRCQRYPPHGLP